MATSAQSKARALMSRSGYGAGDMAGVRMRLGDVAQGKAFAASPPERARGGSIGAPAAKVAVHKHERHDHAGEALTKLARGGKVKHGRHTTKVNVIVAPQGGQQAPPQRVPVPVPVPGGPPPGAAGMPPGGGPGGAPPGLARPPMGPVPGGPPPGLAGGVPPGMRPPGLRGGGRVGYPLDDGAGGGSGRLEKIKAYGGGKR